MDPTDIIAYVLKKFAEGSAATIKKARTFEPQDLVNFLSNAPNDGQELMWKAVVVIGFFGGLRGAELAPIEWQNVSFEKAGAWIKFETVKRRGALKGIDDRFLVPAGRKGGFDYVGVLDR